MKQSQLDRAFEESVGLWHGLVVRMLAELGQDKLGDLLTVRLR